MAEEKSEGANTSPRTHRTRKSDLLSGVSISLVLALIGAVWNLRNDIQGIIDRSIATSGTQYTTEIESLRRNQESTLDQIKSHCDQLIEEEKERAKEKERALEADIRELRTQVLNLSGRRR